MEYSFDPTQDNTVMHQMHFIVNGYEITDEDKRGIKKALKKFGYTSAILSLIYMHREKCITKERCEEMYKINEESEKRMDLLVGEEWRNNQGHDSEIWRLQEIVFALLT